MHDAMAGQLGYIIRSAVLAFMTAGCSHSDEPWEPLPAGTLVVESPSPERGLSAVVIAQQTPGGYTLEIRDARNQETLSGKDIAAPVGYHPHLITLKWSPDGAQVVATIDHDFGDNNLLFELAP